MAGLQLLRSARIPCRDIVYVVLFGRLLLIARTCPFVSVVFSVPCVDNLLFVTFAQLLRGQRANARPRHDNGESSIFR